MDSNSPSPNVQWTLGHTQLVITSNAKYTLTQDLNSSGDGSVAIIIHDLVEEDSTDYTLTVTNSSGTSSVTATLQVQGIIIFNILLLTCLECLQINIHVYNVLDHSLLIVSLLIIFCALGNFAGLVLTNLKSSLSPSLPQFLLYSRCLLLILLISY